MKQEESLVKNIAKGDRAAMRRLYDLYSGYAMAVGRRYLPNRDELQDVMQDSFVKVFSSIRTFEYRGEGSLRSWIARIVANECLDFLRKNKRFSFTDDVPDEAEEEEPEVAALSDDALMEMIGRLPDGYRAVLNMYVFGNLSHKEIAARLGITTGTSASQYHHAKRMLAKMIKEYVRQQ